ncbi:MAG: patatin-like phospholipase family protein [Crocinitomicaceae bacterium]|nr:patatin-like phospholipase family protein [Crocinitomicaceae bacterium]
MTNTDQKWTIKEFLLSFFPFHLIVAHLKHNMFALLFWALLFLFVNDSIGSAFGVPYLFLSPEYLGNVSAMSFLFLGFAFGGFIMAFNTYSYIKLGPKFPFLMTLSKPFLKFCFNNSILPILFVLFYIYKMSVFQSGDELAGALDIIGYNLAFVGGIFGFFVVSFFYFFPVTRRQEKKRLNEKELITSLTHKEESWYRQYTMQRDRRYIYIGKRFVFHRSRSIKHFNRGVILRTFAKNRISASVFEIITICAFFLLGLLNSHDFMEVPAGMSIVLLITITLMLYSALKSWLNNWAIPVLLVIIVSMDFLSGHTDAFNYRNYAYGMDYDKSKAEPYTIANILDVSSNDSINDHSRNQYIQTLENWKKRTGEAKPKLVILNSSGGGSRSALWTMTVLANCDEQLDGKLNQHLQMMTGASGGMVGAAYYRELLLRQQKGQIASLSDDRYQHNIAKDMLNKLSFMATTNDIFIRYQKCQFNGHTYTKDRGFAFEAQLHENTNYAMDHTLGYYREYEESGAIPTMIFSPTIINDGRRLLMSSQPLNFLTGHYEADPTIDLANENIDFLSFFSHQNAEDIRFSSVLRASATFPMVMPMVTMPTEPQIQLMDAGIRDNYGGKTTIQFLHVMSDWIKENTSGVIILQIRDTKKILDNTTYHHFSFMDKLTMPFGNMYKNFPRVQDYNQEELMRVAAQSHGFPIDHITFNLREKKEDRISLSWHLTKDEKKKIKNAFQSSLNKKAFEKLKRLL